jgi:hypothetical protein
MVTGPSESDPLDAGWIWQDPGYNATIHVINGVTEIDVPHGDCIGDYCDNSPVFMHKVTGDFDLQTRALLIGPNDRWITLDFIIYAPDSFLGFLAGKFLKIHCSLIRQIGSVGAEIRTKCLANILMYFFKKRQRDSGFTVCCGLTRVGISLTRIGV